MKTLVSAQPTPNPNALKFVLNRKVKNGDRVSYTDKSQTKNPLANALLLIPSVTQVHFFEQTITITKIPEVSWLDLEEGLVNLIKENIDSHDPDYQDEVAKSVNREELSEELQLIEDILDRHIRPHLQGDGGDLRCIDYSDKTLIIQYEGACGGCPSSTRGTLKAIEGVLQAEFEPEIEVIAAP